MILTTKLKIWTLVCHACIIIGMGHGIVPLGIAELFWISEVFFDDKYLSAPVFQLVAFSALAGQIGIIIAILLKHLNVARWLHIAGLCLLWTSVVLYAYGIRNDNYSHLGWFTCLPLVYCTIRTLLGEHLKLAWQKLVDRM